MKTMIAAAARHNENVEAASDEMTMMTSTAETAGKDGKMEIATTAARHDADAAVMNVTTTTNEAVARTTDAAVTTNVTTATNEAVATTNATTL